MDMPKRRLLRQVDMLNDESFESLVALLRTRSCILGNAERRSDAHTPKTPTNLLRMGGLFFGHTRSESAEKNKSADPASSSAEPTSSSSHRETTVLTTGNSLACDIALTSDTRISSESESNTDDWTMITPSRESPASSPPGGPAAPSSRRPPHLYPTTVLGTDAFLRAKSQPPAQRTTGPALRPCTSIPSSAPASNTAIPLKSVLRR